MCVFGNPGGSSVRPSKGHAGWGESASGLQNHSIGDAYPFAVVGCMAARLDVRGDSARTQETRWYVLDASNGNRFVRWNGETFVSCEEAHNVALELKRGGHSAGYLWRGDPDHPLNREDA